MNLFKIILHDNVGTDIVTYAANKFMWPVAENNNLLYLYDSYRNPIGKWNTNKVAAIYSEYVDNEATNDEACKVYLYVNPITVRKLNCDHVAMAPNNSEDIMYLMNKENEPIGLINLKVCCGYYIIKKPSIEEDKPDDI